MNKCPRCGGDVYARIRMRDAATLGVTCDDCPWISTFRQKTEKTKNLETPDLPNLPPHARATPGHDRL